MITSHANTRIKKARSLKRAKGRRTSGLCLVEGIHHVGQAAEAGLLESLYYSPGLLTSSFAYRLVREQEQLGIPCHAVSPDVIAHLCDRTNPQGLVAVAYTPLATLDNLSPQGFPWVVALVSAQDPGHVGTIARTIDAVGASALVLLNGGTDPYHPRSVRASMGTLFWIPVVQADWERFADWTRRWGYRVYGTSAHAEQHYGRFERYQLPSVLLLGSEREGITPQQSSLCDAVVRIPMCNRASSLSLSVAAGVMLYEMLEALQSTGQGVAGDLPCLEFNPVAINQHVVESDDLSAKFG